MSPRRTSAAPRASQRTAGFARVLGHAAVIQLLQAQRAGGRLAHAYCFTGELGIGKTTVAQAFAEELLLGPEQPPRLAVHPDFWIDDRDEALSIDEIRFHAEKTAVAHDQSLQQFLSFKPFVAPLRVAVLANAERMTEAAQNCLLKTVEEPPPGTVLILTTAFPDHLLPTCLSRCQVVPLAPVSRAALTNWLKEVHGIGEEAERVASLAQGRPGWALRARAEPQWVAALERWAEELSALAFADADAILTYAARFGQGPAVEQRRVAAEALGAFTAWLRDAVLVQTRMAEISIPGDRLTALQGWAERIPLSHLTTTLAAAQRTRLLIDQNVNPRLAMEILLLDSRVRRLA